MEFALGRSHYVRLMIRVNAFLPPVPPLSARRSSHTSLLTLLFDRFIPSFTMHTKQTDLFKKVSRSYGGDLLTKRKNRTHGRPISTQHSMHFVLRSTQARKEWSFKQHERAIRHVIEKFAAKNGVRLNSMANVGNHLHLHVQLSTRHTYRAFIRAITSSIMMKVTGASRWNKRPLEKMKVTANRETNRPTKFWDRRPFSRIVVGFRAFLTMRDYVYLNELESNGFKREQAKFYISWRPSDSS